MSALRCGRPGCPTYGMPTQVNGVWTDPPGWCSVMITGQPVLCRLLCPPCGRAVRGLLGTSAVAVELEREAQVEDAFARGYAEGLDDARAKAASS